MGLRCRNPPRHFSQLKIRPIPLIETPNGQELCRPLYIFHEICIGTTLHKSKFKYQSWYFTPYCWREVEKPTQELQSVKGPTNTFDWNPKWLRTWLSLIYFSWDIFRDPLHKRKFKYQSWYLTTYCGLEVQKTNQGLQSIKGPANTFDWIPKWIRTLPSLIYFSWDIHRDPLHKRKFKYQSWYLTPYCDLEVQKPTLALQSVNGPPIPFIEAPSG